MVIFTIAAIFAVFAYSCCVVAGEEDEAMERMEERQCTISRK